MNCAGSAGYIWFGMLFALLLTFAPFSCGLCGPFPISYVVRTAFNVLAVLFLHCGPLNFHVVRYVFHLALL